MSQLTVLVLLAAYPVVKKAVSWTALSSEERLAAIRYAGLMGGGGWLAFAMIAMVDRGFAAEWPGWAGVLWVVGILGGLFLAVGGWAKLMDIEILPGDHSRAHGAESFLASVPSHRRAWQHRALRGA